MARQTHVVLIDDIDGSEAASTVSFALDGISYEIDLNEEHAEALRESLSEWVARARKVGTARRRSAVPTSNRDYARKVREWAREQGIEVRDRGRIPADIRQQYEDAMAVTAN